MIVVVLFTECGYFCGSSGDLISVGIALAVLTFPQFVHL